MISKTGVDGQLADNVQLVDNVLKQVEAELFAVGRLTQTAVQEKRENIKKEVSKAISVSNQTQRLYFVIRSMIMSVLGALITYVIIWHLGTVNVLQDLVIGVSTYTACLMASRLFDEKIVNISKRIVLLLGEHTKLRDFIVNNF